jgi:hypothetical protein
MNKNYCVGAFAAGLISDFNVFELRKTAVQTKLLTS